MLNWALDGRGVLRRVLRRGSKKGLSRRNFEGSNMPFQECNPLCVRPMFAMWRAQLGRSHRVAELHHSYITSFLADRPGEFTRTLLPARAVSFL